MEPTTTTPKALKADDFTIRHCTEWCNGVGIDPAFVPEMVAELMDDGPDSTLSWPTIARVVGARFTDGYAFL